jgi:hypothetical protein
MIGKTLSAVSPVFSSAYKTVLTNRKYFKKRFFSAGTAQQAECIHSFLGIPFLRITTNFIWQVEIKPKDSIFQVIQNQLIVNLSYRKIDWR